MAALFIVVFISLFPLTAAADEWYNSTWHFRQRFEFNASGYPRINWPVEFQLNFTYLLQQANSQNLSFDINSLRLFEYNSSGQRVYEVPYQFEPADAYNLSSNAVGELIFIINGTTQTYQKRTYYAYFDSVANGTKPPANYASSLSYSQEGKEFNVNNTFFQWYADIARGENASGIYAVIGNSNELFNAPSNELPYEYSQYTNGTSVFGFNFTSITNKSGPIRIAVTLTGNETYWNDPYAQTGEARLIKKYSFYNLGNFIKIEQTYISTAAGSINRSSTASGAVAFEAERLWGIGYTPLENTTDPYSWSHASDAFNSFGVGIINIVENNTANFVSQRDAASGRIGITLLETDISAGSNISETAIMKFNDTAGDLNSLRNMSLGMYDSFAANISDAEEWKVNFTIRANYSIYNRNETVLILLNLTSDIYNFTTMANATLNNGTANPSDDFIIQLYDDGAHYDGAAGDKLYANNYTLPIGAELGEWNVSALIFANDTLPLASNYSLFNVTDEYNSTLTIWNPFGLVDRFVNATFILRNFRQDRHISNAVLACNYSLNTSTDYGNGTYFINFLAPPLPGNYSIQCNASKGGNFISNFANFASEAAKTNATVLHSPGAQIASNVTSTQNFNFSLTINATNYGEGSANLANITLQLPAYWGSSAPYYSCANVSVGSTCSATFDITVANLTASGNYSLNSTFNWQNPDGTLDSNSSLTLVTVLSNPIIDVIESSFYSIVGLGHMKQIGNFTIRSIGNDPLQNLTFNVAGFSNLNFTFIPATIASVPANSQTSVQLNVTIPLNQSSGEYLGTIIIATSNAGNDSIELNLSISGANVSVIATPNNFTANNITQTLNQTFSLQVNITNQGNATAYFANITLQLPTGLQSDSSISMCGNLSVGAGCNATFLITVLNATAPGNYLINASSAWNDLEDGIKTNSTPVNVTVLSNPIMQVSSTLVLGNVTHGNTTIFGNFSILSTGNDAIQNISINLTGLSNFSVSISPSFISNISAGSLQTILVNITVPFAYDPGNENGTLAVSTSNDGGENVTLAVSVSTDRDWEMSPTFCAKTESPNVGLVCQIDINNTGNALMDFTVSPSSANFTEISNTSFSIWKQSAFSFNVTYNITGQPKIIYNSTYAVNATSAGSFPATRSLQIALEPFQSLAVATIISPMIIQNNENVTFDFNVTDANLVGMQNVTARVVLPNSTATQVSLYLVNTIYNASGNITQWRGAYPNVTGSTALMGNYTVYITAIDNVDANGTANGAFYSYPKLNPSIQTLSSSYARGSTASLYARARDMGGAPLQNANVTIWAFDNSSILVFNSSYSTAVSGIVEPLPTLSILEDAALGTWNLYSYVFYHDAIANVTVNGTSNSTFTVVQGSAGNVSFSGLLTDFITSDLFFGGDTVQFAISVYDVNGAPLDPDFMNITVFSPNESVYLQINFSEINRSSEGLYYYKFVVPRNETSGVYRAELNAIRGAYFTRNTALFRISTSLFADVETSFVWYPASVMTFRMLVYAGDGMPIDPTALNLTVIDPAGNTYFSVQLASMTRQSTGYYLYNHAMGVNTSTGNYYAQIIASKDASTTYKLLPFRVSAGGPYDVRLELLENQVYTGEYLDFRAVIENKGPVSQDVTLEYWVSDGVQTWYYGSEAVLTPAYQNSTFLRSAYIFTSQPIGAYALNGRVTYDLIKPPIDVNYSFMVVGRPQASPTTVIPGSSPTAAPVSPGGIASPSASPPPFNDYSGMQIISYPDEISIQAGEIKYPKIQVKNTGLVALHNITLALAGMPSGWVELLPYRVNALAPGDIATFVIKITVPTTEKTSVRKIRAIVLSSERKEEVRFDLAVFGSKLALIEHEIQRLKEKAQKIAKDAAEAEKAGKNVKPVWEAIDQAQKYLSDAENNLRSEELDDALSNTQIADTYLGKANALLVTAPFNPPSYTQLPNWITIALGVVGTSMGVLVFWFVRKRKKQQPAPAKESAGMIEKVSEVLEKTDLLSLQKEKSKILRALRLLEEEMHDGSISQGAFFELKKRYDRKLVDLDRKLH
ncbi:MAG: NEW3 domain-containing protein [Candidatus Micrarchaeota archaeon]